MKGSECGIKLMMTLSKKKKCDGEKICFARLKVTVIGLYDSLMFTLENV